MANSESLPTPASGRRPVPQQNSLVQRTRLRDTLAYLALFAALLWLMSQSAFAQVGYQYQYSGNAFTAFQCDSGGNPDCPSPGANNPYTTSSSITAVLTLDSRLAANSGALDLSSNTSLQVALTDGIAPLSWNGGDTFLPEFEAACVATDSNGNVSAWYLRAATIGDGSHSMYSFYDPHGVFANLENCQHPEFAGPIYGQDLANHYDYINNVQRYGYTSSSSQTLAQGTWTAPAPPTHHIGGTLSGLTGSGSVVLQNNGADNLSLSGNGTFTFATPIADGNPYAVTVLSAPVGLYCAVTNGSGTVNGAEVTNVQVNCAPSKTYTYSGHGFKLFECATSPNPDCANPGPGNPYKTSNSITASLTLASPLENNLGPTDITGRAGFQLTLNDGQNTLSPGGQQCCVSAWVTTNASGEITTWFLAVSNGDGGTYLFTLYDPGSAIAEACDGCYNSSASGTEEDYGQFFLDPTVYGYNLLSHGSFSPGYPGGSTTAGNCLSSGSLPCNLVPGNSFAIRGPNAAAIPPGTILTEQECVVPADPRGANCGAFNGHFPRSLNVSDLPQCKGFGNEVIPDYLCGASGSSGTGFALILGNAEQADTFNGTYGDSELNVEKIPGLAGAATNPTCPKTLLPPTVPSALAAVGTRSGSLVEEQTPERTFDGRPLLVEMTSSCEPPRSNHGPGLTLEGAGFKLRTKDPAGRGGLTDMQSLLLLANYKYFNLDVVMLLTKFPNNTPTRRNLQTCINKSQILLDTGSTHYFCAAEQVYRCEQIVDGTDFNQFGPTRSFLRLPDPYGDVVRRLGNLFYTINTRINGQHPNVDWPLPASPGHPAGDPYPSLGCP